MRPTKVVGIASEVEGIEVPGADACCCILCRWLPRASAPVLRPEVDVDDAEFLALAFVLLLVARFSEPWDACAF